MNDAQLFQQAGTMFIAGTWCKGTDSSPVFDKFSGALLGTVERASKEQVDDAVAAARHSFETVKLEPYERYRILLKASELIEQRRDQLARTIVAESGIPVSDALNEVSRAAQTLIVSAEESKRLTGEMVPIESAPGRRSVKAKATACSTSASRSVILMRVH